MYFISLFYILFLNTDCKIKVYISLIQKQKKYGFLWQAKNTYEI